MWSASNSTESNVRPCLCPKLSFLRWIKQHSNITSNICSSELFLRGMKERRQHVQQQHTWLSGGSQHQNNKQTKVCRSLTEFIVHGRAPLRQTKKTSEGKYGGVERSPPLGDGLTSQFLKHSRRLLLDSEYQKIIFKQIWSRCHVTTGKYKIP